jgi:hypothetical protein
MSEEWKVGKWEAVEKQTAGQRVYVVRNIFGKTIDGQPLYKIKGPAWETQEEAAAFAAKLNEEEK